MVCEYHYIYLEGKTNVSSARLLLWSVIIGLSVHPLITQAQVTAIARITLTVIPAPGINFASTNPIKSLFSINQATDGAIALRASGNVSVVLNFHNHKRILDMNCFRQGETKTLTSKEFIGVSKVEVLYLGI